MEINRKTYSWIIKLLKSKNISSDDALDLADDICILLEENKVETIENTIQNVQSNILPPYSNKEPEPRKFKPYEKVRWGQVDWKWKFHPIPAWPARGWIRDDSWRIVEV